MTFLEKITTNLGSNMPAILWVFSALIVLYHVRFSISFKMKPAWGHGLCVCVCVGGSRS